MKNKDNLDRWRKKIDQIDRALIALLNKRQNLALRIGAIKKKLNLKIQDPKREKEMLKKIRKEAKNYNLPPSFIERLFRLILKESRDLQERE